MTGLATRMTIVLVDDDEGHTELVRRNLRRAGVEHDLVRVDPAHQVRARTPELANAPAGHN